MGWSEESRLAARIRERVANVVLFELQDPRILAGRVTITRVRLSRDLSTCRAYFSVYGTDGERSKVQHALNDAAGHVQREVGKVLRTRTIPHLKFEYDPAIEGGMRITGLIDQLKAERQEAEEEEETSSDSVESPPSEPDDSERREPPDAEG